MSPLSPREEEVMHILWKIEKGFVNDILNMMEDPKPPYNTVSSIVRKLVANELVGYRAYGRTHEYFPLLNKKKYGQWSFRKLLRNYFDGSPKQILSHFVEEGDLDKEDLEDLLKQL